MARFSAHTQNLLEIAYQDFHKTHHRADDPIETVHAFARKDDQEVAGFLAACLSYGNVRTILSSVARIFQTLGRSPYDAVRSGGFEERFDEFYHRFTVGDDIEILCHWLKGALEDSGSLEAYVAANHPAGTPMKEILGDFVARFTAQPLPTRLGPIAKRRIRNLKYLIPDPNRGSACKRLNMYLRWMVRPADGIDLGLWSRLHPKQLVLPVDTHLLQTLHRLKWTASQQATWKVAEAATATLRLYSPEDPVRFDFALCHLSMLGRNISDYATVERRSAHQKGPAGKL